MNETTEKCSQARYARTISKVAIFLVKSDTVYHREPSKNLLWQMTNHPKQEFVLDKKSVTVVTREHTPRTLGSVELAGVTIAIRLVLFADELL